MMKETPKIIIAIDGFSSTGKSTFARLIAERLGLTYLDSGALYRAITLYALERGMIKGKDEIDLIALGRALEGDLTLEMDKSSIWLCGRDVRDRIRDKDINDTVSPVSAIPFVRDFVDGILRKCSLGGCVTDGRDIGTAVFPDADLKIFMTSSDEVRATRRFREMISQGRKVTYEEVLSNVRERDFKDSHRDFHPLRRPSDAIVLDNSYMTIDEQIEWLSPILKERFNITL